MTIGRDSLVKDLGLATHFENIPASLGPGDFVWLGGGCEMSKAFKRLYNDV